MINQKFLPAARNLNIYDLQRLISKKKISTKNYGNSNCTAMPFSTGKANEAIRYTRKIMFLYVSSNALKELF